ncbi:MAG: ice-binding family protein [Patescibacteria group bacterium]
MRYAPVAVFALLLAPMAQAATTPSLGAASSYGVLANTYTNTTAGTTVNGDLGFTTGPAVTPAGIHNHFGSGAPYSTAGSDQASALGALASQGCTFTFGGGAIDLSTDITHGAAGIYTPGVYCNTGAMNVGGPLNLNGNGTFIFRTVGALTSTAGAVVTLTGGASASDVFWTPTAATTLAANTTFVGTDITNAGITVGANTNWLGRSLAFGGTITTDTDTITVPTTLRVIKEVSNTHGGIATAGSFSMHVKLGGSDIAGSPLPGVSVLGTAYAVNPGTYVVSEDIAAGYTGTFSGDCDATGNVLLAVGDTKTCTITNADIGTGTPPAGSNTQVPPLINLRKVPSPLALPAGPGQVIYTYTATNPGQIPITNVTLTDNKCSNVTFVGGDTNGNSQLDINETWTYTCATTLQGTTVNYATIQGLGNGMAAVDTAIAEVVVGVPVVPPLIHILKTPNTLTLPSNGGAVTYTYVVTNPGTVPLTGVTVTDDKCSTVTRESGDNNDNSELDVNETWTYTCTTNIPQTTTNTAVATGHANGLTAIDTSLATVVVAGLTLPPPLIHIVKMADPVILPSTGGLVTYTYTVTNPGTVPLTNVNVTDDKCATVTRVSGDINVNNLLDTNETWTYTCQQNLTASTTNTATATATGANANSLAITDISLANVVLASALLPAPPAPVAPAPPAPKLPNTGVAPMNSWVAWVVSAAGLFVAGTLLYAVSKRKNLS